MAKARNITSSYTVGSGNVFADIGLANPEMELAKAQVAHRIARRIAVLNLSQTKAAARMGIDQPRVSKIVRGRLGDFAFGELVRLSLALGIGVRVSLSDETRPTAIGHLAVCDATAARHA